MAESRQIASQDIVLATGALAQNRRVAAIGDSRETLGVNSGGASRNFNARGLLDWARFLTKQRFDHDIEDIFATSGQTSQYIAENHLLPAIASGAGTIVCLVSLNDRSSGFTAAGTIAQLTIIRDTVLATGRALVFVAETPSGNSVDTGNRLASPQLQYHLQVHEWLKAQDAPGKGVFVADPWPVLADQTVTTGDNITARFTDGKHPNQLGAYFGFGVPLAAIFARIFASRNIIPSSLADGYDAANNPRGVLTANITTAGVGGTITTPAAGVLTGDIANSYTAALSNGTGLTVALTKVADADGKIWQQAVITGTPTSAGAALSFSLPSVATLAGDVLDTFAEMETDAGQTGINRIICTGFAGTDSVNAIDMDAGGAADAYPAVALAGVLRSPRYTRVNDGTLAVSTSVRFLQNVAVSATVRFRALGGRKIV